MNTRMKTELASLMKTPIERGWFNGLRCFNSASSVLNGVTTPTLLQPRVLLYDAVSHLCHRAALRVLSYLPLPYSALNSLLVIPTPFREVVYDYVAKGRYKWFGKAEDYLVLQEKELLQHFIDREELMSRRDQDS